MLNTGYWLLVTALRIPHDTPTASHSSLPTAYLILGAQQLRGVVARGDVRPVQASLRSNGNFSSSGGALVPSASPGSAASPGSTPNKRSSFEFSIRPRRGTFLWQRLLESGNSPLFNPVAYKPGGSGQVRAHLPYIGRSYTTPSTVYRPT